MKRQHCSGLGILLTATMALVLVACGSSNGNTPEPQANQTNSQASADTPEVSGAGTEASLGELIVGSWVDTSPDISDMLDFLPDGRFFMDSGVDYALAGDITYEAFGANDVILTDHRYTQDNTSHIVVGDINEDSMTLLHNPWSGGEVTYRKLRGADNLPVDILGLWSLDPVQLSQSHVTQPDIWFAMMLFDPDGTFPLTGSTGTTYQILSDSAIALVNPDFDQSVAIRVDNISGDSGAFQFGIGDPPVHYKRHREDDQLKERLVGLWADGDIEFTHDGRLIDNVDDQIYSYRIYDDGTFVSFRGSEMMQDNHLNFKSDDEIELCFPQLSETGSLFWECGGDGLTWTRTKAP